MKLKDAKALALSLMASNGLDMKDWWFAFDHARRRFGSCSWTMRKITLSRHLVLLNDELEVAQTILHEIAHALTPGDGHGRAWAAKCVELGITPARCYDEGHRAVVGVAPKYQYKCDSCGQTVGRFKRMRSRTACADCCRRFAGGRWDERFLFSEVL